MRDEIGNHPVIQKAWQLLVCLIAAMRDVLEAFLRAFL